MAMASTTSLRGGQYVRYLVFLSACLQLLPAVWTVSRSSSVTLESRMRDDPDLSEFYSLIERDEIAMSKLVHHSLTIFAPTNQAFQRYLNNKTHLNYHMSSTPLRLSQLADTVRSLNDDGTPLYITRTRPLSGMQEDLYVNSAKIIRERSNMEFTNTRGYKQILHIIDDVLTPITTVFNKTLDTPNPDAWGFLQSVEAINIEPHRVRSFRKKILNLKRDQAFKKPGISTFFIPVETGFKVPPHPTLSMVDKRVIDGHIIPNKAIFTTPAPYGQALETLQFEDDLRVTITFFRHDTGKNARVFVVSNTMYSNSRLTPGAVIAEIVKANIPVANGVVHLIHRPLVIVDMHGVQMLTQDNSHTLWSKFRDLIEDFAPDFLNILRGMNQMTIFVPQDDAVSQMMQTNFMSNRKKLLEVLMMHVVPDAITIDKIKRNNQNHIYQIPTMTSRRFIYFNLNENRTTHAKSVTVEGGGVNASLVLGDIATKDGYIHIIDRMLGVSYMTVQEKLETDPMLNLTYHFGKLNHFNDQLNMTNKRFTYFVPRDKAWIQWFIEHPAANLDDFVRNRDQSRLVLEHHLIVADRVFSMGELRNMSHDSLILPTVGPESLQIRVKEEDNRFFIQWKETGRWTTVFRADVECTNGLIHVIDAPFVHEYDMITSGGSPVLLCSTALTLVVTVLAMLVATVGTF
ncbi:fasciclin-1 [Anopheles marshallii]|uniref:fasciclin-1 n=1 Tax=Anopheles marshallii TaxID=1521116 RepID=UPI00237A64E9|nr:fasciclin-1 [Anopheles marshallii]